MAHGNVPVAQSVRAAFDFVRLSLPRTAGVLAAVMLLNLLEAAVAPMALRVLIVLLAVLAGVMANGALLRLAFGDEHPGDPDFRPGPLGFQWGGQETRLLGATLLLALLVVLAFLFWVFIAIVFGATAMVVGGTGAAPPGATPPQSVQLIVALLALALLAVGLWVGVRVSLYPAATVAERKIMVFSTWNLTHGQFWRILAAIVLALAPALALTLILVNVRLAPALGLALALLLSAVNAFLELPLLCGLYAYLYRGLRPSGT